MSGPALYPVQRECDCDEAGGNRDRREQGQQYWPIGGICGAEDRPAATGTVSMTWAARRQDRRSPLSRGSRGTLHFTRELRAQRLMVHIARQSADNLTNG